MSRTNGNASITSNYLNRNNTPVYGSGQIVDKSGQNMIGQNVDMSNQTSIAIEREVDEESEAEGEIFDEEAIQRAIHGNYENIEEIQKQVKNLTAEELFKAFNTSGTGLITFDEFRNMLPYLGFNLTSAKAFRFFHLCDTDGSGQIDIDEFKVALFTVDPTSGNPVGYTPSSFLSPLDAFETFDEAKIGLLDEDEFHFAMRFLGIELTDAEEEALFENTDYNSIGSIDYDEFRSIYLKTCDVKKQLEDRGVDVPVLAKRQVLEDILSEILDEEEKRERRALQEAKRYKEWMILVKEKKKLLQRAQWRAYHELRAAMDAAGQVYVFGSGSRNQFSSPLADYASSSFDMFERLVKVWEDRVRPEQLINRLRLQRRAEEQEILMKRKRDEHAAIGTTGIPITAPGEGGEGEGDKGYLGALGPAMLDIETQRRLIDPYREALKSRFRGLNVAVNTAVLWGKRVHHVAVSENVIFALADTGEIFSWGGNNHWWNEIQPDSIYQSKWRGDTTPRSQLLLGTVEKGLSKDPSFAKDTVGYDDLSEEDKKCEVIKVLAKYFNVWEPPPGTVPRLQYFEKDLMPRIKYDDIVHALECRGQQVVEGTKMELMNMFYHDIILEKKLLGERTHKAIRELESQVLALRKRRKFKMAENMRQRIEELWMPLLEVQAEKQSVEMAQKSAEAYNKVMRTEAKYVDWRHRIELQREDMKEEFTPRGNSLQIDISGVTPRGMSQKTPRGYQSAIQVAAGSAHACLVHKSGQLYTWGVGASGRLGLDLTEGGDPQKDVMQPKLVQALAGRPVLKVACGYSHSGAVVAGGDLFVWGSAAMGKLGLGDSVKDEDCYCSVPTIVRIGQNVRCRKIACGSMHSAVVTEAGQLYVFGCGDGGRLGLGWGQNRTVYEPVLAECLLHERISSVSCGNSSTVVATEIRQEWIGDAETRYRAMVGGRVYIAGSGNVFGRFYEEFTLLKSMEGIPVKQVSAGYQHTALVTADGELYCWGHNKGVCCGTAHQVTFLENPTRVSCLYQAVRNLSLGCKAEQSSTYNSREAGFAVNGDKSGLGIRRLTSTQQDPQGWWEVDLGHIALIDEVRIWNRTDVPTDPTAPRDQYTSRLFPFWVMVGVHPFQRETGAKSLSQNLSDSIARAKFTEQCRVSKWRCPANTQGRYVRIQLEGFNYLTLAEVEVFGNFGFSRGVGRVSFAAAGRDVTVAVVRATTDPREIESRFKRAVYADAANADILRQLETYALAYDKFGRGEIISQCEICQPRIDCEICVLKKKYKEEIDKMIPGIGGRRRRLNSIDEYLILNNKPELMPFIQRKLIRPGRFEHVKSKWSNRLGWLFKWRNKGTEISEDDKDLIKSFDSGQIIKAAATEGIPNFQQLVTNKPSAPPPPPPAPAGPESVSQITGLEMMNKIREELAHRGTGTDIDTLKKKGRDPFPKSIRSRVEISREILKDNG